MKKNAQKVKIVTRIEVENREENYYEDDFNIKNLDNLRKALKSDFYNFRGGGSTGGIPHIAKEQTFALIGKCNLWFASSRLQVARQVINRGY